jgi:hypothetical protein
MCLKTKSLEFLENQLTTSSSSEYTPETIVSRTSGWRDAGILQRLGCKRG